MDEEEAEVAEFRRFFGVYLLITLNPKYKGRTYIGFTVDPNRRIKQHNRGKAFGGASKTSSRGPWEMLLIVHGFPNQIAALRFEWAWQHPKRSRRLGHVAPKKASERMFDYNIRLLSEMLNAVPWKRLPLTVRWLRPDVKFKAFSKAPPQHMPIVRGAVKIIRKKTTSTSSANDGAFICAVCFEDVSEARKRIRCCAVLEKCGAVAHITCLADKFRAEDEDLDEDRNLIPIRGSCPVCESKSLWGDLILSINSDESLPEEDEDEEDES